MGPHSRSPRFIPYLILAILIVAGAVAAVAAVHHGPSSAATIDGTHIVDGDTVPTVTNLSATSFVDPGPLAVGETTLTLPSDKAPVEVWYPATAAAIKGHTEGEYNVGDWLPPALAKLEPPGFSVTYPSGGYRGVPVAPGRYPLVLFSHGYAGFRDQSTFLTAWLASWGFVVAAPDHLDRDLTAVLSGVTTKNSHDVNDLMETIDLMTHENGSTASALHSHLDLSKIGVVGHSAGGEAAEKLAAADPRVTTFIGMAGASVGAFGSTFDGKNLGVPHKPGMLMVGTDDHVANPKDIAHAFTKMVTPKRLVTLTGAGHLAFSDICELAPGQGGLLVVAAKIGIAVPAYLKPLASDGCQVSTSQIHADWSVIRQAVTAQLRHVFNFDTSSAGLDDLKSAFPGRVTVNISVPASH